MDRERTTSITVNLKEQIRDGSGPDRLLEAVFDLSRSERRVYEELVELDESVTVAGIAAEVGCAETSAYRYVDTLEERGLCRKASENYGETRRSAYVATPPDLVAERMEQEVQTMFERCQSSIETCRAALARRSNA